jgi:hypothetical protein
MERDCRNCEWYDQQRIPNAGLLAGRKPYCIGLGFFLFGNHAPDCKLYRPRPGVTIKQMGR